MRICRYCNQPKEDFNSNGYCRDCDRERYRMMYRAAPDTDYLTRHLAKREVEATNCLEDNNGESCEVLDFIKQEGGWRDQVNYFLRQPKKSFQFQVR